MPARLSVANVDHAPPLNRLVLAIAEMAELAASKVQPPSGIALDWCNPSENKSIYRCL